MAQLRRTAIAALSAALYGFMPTMAAEPIGQATLIKTEVSGATGPLAVRDPVHRDERIRTSRSGLGQFIFRDGSKLAVGAGSSVVIDKFVYDDSQSVQQLTVTAAKGTFRWISGNSKHSAYNILTPSGTIGVRGTVFDFYVGDDGTTAIVLLSGAAQFCGRGGCQPLTRRCDCVVARPGGAVTKTQRVDRSILTRLGNRKALPFLSGDQKLSVGFGGMSGSCGLSAALEIKPTSPTDIRPPEKATPRKAISTEPGRGGQDTGKGGQDTGKGGQDRGKGGQDRGKGGQDKGTQGQDPS
ncbi:FecR domain-containing protein [Ensifer sp. BR816]|uniref:FecR family protein n=1 Tax=Rhizobium sp. (strain BR816) TaxID=1057002 RepID=UPI00037AA5FD|nr:FecR domain-containing protein [Ensifer sp. BR816]